MTSSKRLANAHEKRKGCERENRIELECSSNERRKEEGGTFSTEIRCLTCYELFEMSLLQGQHSFLVRAWSHCGGFFQLPS